MLNEELIKKVRKYPILYNERHKDFEDLDKKRSVWEKIANELDISPIDVMRRWQCLNDRFARESRIIKDNSENKEQKIKSWPLYNSLLFLRCNFNKIPNRKSAASAKSSTNVPPSVPERLQPPPLPSALLPILESATVETQETPTDKRVTRSKGRPVDESDVGILRMVEKYKAFCKSRMKRRVENNEVYAFGQYLMSVIATLSEPAQARVMHQCISIITEAMKIENAPMH
ncbi:uncharacterized protein LOC119689104 [Teleopsis dalmanni]|uniref:uncharacterized protein LOC119689068 n=1 Tax=Teleopsis dalmanni TaxID=139649 RepID=UPI0018CEDE59|nr:uncharacterized protein LOC119689068 [Teleopsis dalmanni]XP_037959770.1 uncharacterized protein LOC119689104 [Teleopsis dalmanni]